MIGGARKKKQPDTAQKVLLDELWKLKGGPKEVSDIIGIPVQSPINWRNRGGVPLKFCMLVSLKLKVPMWGLNYKELLTMYGKDKTPAWPLVVKSYGFSKDVVSKILSAPIL